MKKLTDYRKINDLVSQIRVERAYPLSVIESIQSGEVFVDNDEAPGVALIWHYCGFASILGDHTGEFIEETMKMMQDPPESHSWRMALQIENDSCLEDMILKTPKVNKHERYIFDFAGEKGGIPHNTGLKPEMLSSENYELMKGGIIPTFSWDDKKEFLNKGFGYCLIGDGQMLACAFASGVSNAYVDIGVETAEECRGKGYGKIVASAMVKEILRRGKIPTWGCDTRNEASMRLACSVGFEITGTHPWYIFQGSLRKSSL